MVRVAALVAAGCALSACFFTPERPVDDTTTNGAPDSKLALGRKHACAIDGAGELWCWGQNRYAQLGKSPLDVSFSGTPQRVGAGPWTAVVAGTEHSCALREGQVSCWGANYVGQSSTGSDSAALPTVIDVPSPSPLVRLDAGGAASCAFDEAGAMYCWGRIDATTVDGIKPARIEPAGIATGWAQIGIAADHACARTTAGDVHCWGNNGILQLGLADENASVALANAVTVAEQLDELAVGPNSNCGITRDDRLYCWGDPVITQSPDPTTGRTLDTRAWSRISIGDRHACAVTTGREAYCWGSDSNGALGRGTLKEATSDRMFGDAAMTSASVAVAGDGFSCARSVAGELSCWGANIYGELGNGDIATAREPYQLAVSATDLALGDRHTCVRSSADRVTCWGNNFEGQLGSPASPPVSTPPAPLASLHGAIAAGTSHTCGRSLDGTQLTCWGIAAAQRSLDGGNAASVTLIQLATAWNGFAASGNTTCGKSDNGAITCWGALGGMAPVDTASEMYLGPRVGVYVRQDASNNFVYHEWGSECFSASTDRPLSLAASVRMVASSVTIEQVAVGTDHVCSIENGEMWCWGRAEFGEAGPPVQTCASPRKIAHPLARLWRSVTAAGHHTCATDTAAQLYCWGENDFFELGSMIDGGSTVPQLADATRTWSKVVTGVSHTCGLTNAGELYCWGLNRFGEIGNGKTFVASPMPVAMP